MTRARSSRALTPRGAQALDGESAIAKTSNTALTVEDTGRQQGSAPFELARTYAGEAGTQYESRFDVTVVMKGGKTKSQRRHQEKWKDPGRSCRVMTTSRAGDTLGCIFGKELPGTP